MSSASARSMRSSADSCNAWTWQPFFGQSCSSPSRLRCASSGSASPLASQAHRHAASAPQYPLPDRPRTPDSVVSWIHSTTSCLPMRCIVRRQCGSMISRHSNAGFSMKRYALIVSLHPWHGGMLAVGFAANRVSSVFARSLHLASPRHLFQLPIYPAFSLSRHLPAPRITRVNADSLLFTTPPRHTNLPASPCVTRLQGLLYNEVTYTVGAVDTAAVQNGCLV